MRTVRKTPYWVGAFLFIMGTLVSGASVAYGQAPAKTKLKKILVLNKSQFGINGHRESRADFMKALAELALEKGFTITTLGQDAPASTFSTEFSTAGLAGYHAVIFCYNDGVDRFLDSTQKRNFEAYVKNGGGFIAIHSASDFIINWTWITSVLVESYYGPHGTNQPTANLTHDLEGTATGAETQGIFKGLTAPAGFLDEFYSFRASPRGRPGVTILLTVDEKSFSKSINGPMGDDHPVAWTKSDGRGRVAHLSLGHSWSTNNVYAAKNGYLKYFLYGAMRYVAGDFIGCTDSRNVEYNPDATKSDPTACFSPDPLELHAGGERPARTLLSRNGTHGYFVDLSIRAKGHHAVTLVDRTGRVIRRISIMGHTEISAPKTKTQ